MATTNTLVQYVKAGAVFINESVFGPSSTRNTALYRRFMRVPRVLSFAITAAFATMFTWIALSPNGYWGGFFGGLLILAVLTSVSPVKGVIYALLLKRRLLNAWGDKFQGWDHFRMWILMTGTEQVEAVAGMPDKDWVPNTTGGWTLITDGEVVAAT